MTTGAPSGPVRVRFAPSPTGYLHVGGARTALFNWLYARKTDGRLLLRIEDTDVERSSVEMVQGILDGMKWLGLDWDEGPFFQSARHQQYRQSAELLVEKEHAYFCFCSPEELTARRERAAALKLPGRYEDTCRSLAPGEARARRDRGEAAAIRFHVPGEGKTVFHDLVFGEVSTEHAIVEDFVLMRSDGHPTYHLSVVVDDAEMAISHVIRGADHLSNTPKQILLYHAFGREIPVFAHVPLILGPDKSRLSKRHGATSVMAYREMGFMPEAFRNFLALLGWSPGNTDREIYPTRDLLETFSLEGISRTNAVFDLEKALWMNGQYLSSMPARALLNELEPLFRQRNLWDPGSEAGGHEHVCAVIDLLKSRARLLNDLAEAARPYLSDSFEVDPAAVEKNIRRHPELKTLLPELARRLERLPDFDPDGTETALRGLAEERGVKAGQLINAARTAVTGSAATPGIFDVLVHAGRERVVKRLRAAAERIP